MGFIGPTLCLPRVFVCVCSLLGCGGQYGAPEGTWSGRPGPGEESEWQSDPQPPWSVHLSAQVNLNLTAQQTSTGLQSLRGCICEAEESLSFEIVTVREMGRQLKFLHFVTFLPITAFQHMPCNSEAFTKEMVRQCD